MSIVDFSWIHALSGLAGGALIGLAAVILMLGLGKIAGISGIVGSCLQSVKVRWQWAFIAGLLISGLIYHKITPIHIELAGDLWLFIIAGLLVGFGTRMGNGCTSGHGVCGLARGAKRSFVATLIFIGTAVITVTLIRYFQA